MKNADFKAALGLLVTAVAVSGCSWFTSGNPALERDEARAQVQKLEARVQELEAHLAKESRPVELINPVYPPAVGGVPGWEYHKTLVADLDSDGQDETVSVTTNPLWIPEEKAFGWDDGHPWHVYVQESDGSRTYLFSDWVQLGRLEVILDREGPGVYILSSRGGGIVVYHAAYKGVGQTEAKELFSIPLSDYASWADPLIFAR